MIKRLIPIVIMLLLALAAAGIFLPKDYDSQEQVFFTVAEGEGLREIARNLDKDGLIWQATFFEAYALLRGRAGNLQAGSYLLSASMNVSQIMEKLFSGDVAKETVTIPEGFTADQIRQKLEDVTADALLNLEECQGYLFPDTYYIPHGASQDEIVGMMIDNFERKTADLPVTSEVVIMASILEKEVKTEEEKELAAGVLWKRLSQGWFLQVDACPWTYENRGLPPRPICNPGLESITATLYPENSQYWYYISKPDGETIFQRTLEEHNAAKAEYLK